jgi:carboxypeptidase Taq
MLHWDLATVMPPGGAEARAEQLAVLKSVRHGLLTDGEVDDLLAAAETGADLDPWQRANVREMRRVWLQATALTAAQVEALSRATSVCEAAWRDARADDDFPRVLPSLTDLLDRVRETAAAKAEALGLSPYDALLDQYEPDARSAELDRLFGELEETLPPLLAAVLDRQSREPPAAMASGPFPIDRQREVAVRLMERIGFDFHHGRLDVSLHPFCGGTPDDVRITTRYDESAFATALMGVLHETGHALYERGLPRAWRSQPVGEARGMALHESQSLLIEMQVCRSREFLHFAGPLLGEAFGGEASVWDAANLFRFFTRVRPGYIRVEADELTYPFHVILRYRLEKAMLAGDLQAGDLPAAWNDAVENTLGLPPAGDRLGCLQDIHWYDGAWGYFPTYTLGAIAAAQIFAAAADSDPALCPGLARGDFAPLIGWLREHVHGKGSLLSSRALLIEATGRPLDAGSFLDHLRRRYLP